MNYYIPGDNETEPINPKHRPTVYKTKEQCEQEAQAMIDQFEYEKSINPMNYVGGCLYLLIVVGVPAGLVALFIWIANSIGFFDMIAAKWAMVP